MHTPLPRSSRRSFLQKTALAGAGLALSRNIAIGTSDRPIKGANERINVAVIGLRGIGKSHLGNYLRIPENVRIAALCDCDTQPLDWGVARLAEKGIKPKTFRDLRKLLEDKEVDAVSVCTPNHWHALATIWACQAGKHVCVEKPVSHSIWEGRKMVEAARKYDRMVQADLDSRSNVHVAAAIRYMQQHLGRVHHVRIVNYKRRESIGRTSGPGLIPSTCDYDLHCGPIPMTPLLRKELHYDWHWQWPTGNGELGNNGPHQLDVCRWALGKDHAPQKVLSFGGRFGYVDDGTVPNTQVAWFDYDGIPVVYDSRALGEKSGVNNMDGFTGVTATGKKVHHPFTGSANCTLYIFCENGYLTGDCIFDNDGKFVRRFEEPGKVGPQINFIRALKSGKRADLRTDILEGHVSANISHIGNISYQIGHRVGLGELRKTVAAYKHLPDVLQNLESHLKANGLDPEKEQLFQGPELTFDSSSETFTGGESKTANLFLKDNYRPPFVVPEIV